MEALRGTGRTVLFVSQSMPSLLRLCPRVILLDGGHLTAVGSGSHIVEEYMGPGWRGRREGVAGPRDGAQR
jgi:lipopolysaccharide transport system ATP-binding protein